MISHDSDILLSVISSSTAAVLLFSLQWTSTACLLVLCSLYFLTKLWKTDQVESPKDFQVIIVGAGVAGIAMGKKLNDLGIRYVILEKSDSLGGTWYENTYPGCACDITSHLYSFSFYQNPRWSRAFSRQPEILSYLQDVACKFGVFPHIKFGKTIKRNIWNQETHQWTLETSEGETLTANVVISGVGFLHVAKYPNIPVMKQFKGQAFHTSSWPKDYSPRNKRIAIIGTGASAVQTVPNVAAMEPANLTVFQRTPCWSPLRHDHLYPEWVKIVFTYVPFTNTMFRWFHFWVNELFYRIIFTTDSWITVKASALAHYIVKKHITDIVKDQKLAARLTPSYNMDARE